MEHNNVLLCMGFALYFMLDTLKFRKEKQIKCYYINRSVLRNLP